MNGLDPIAAFEEERRNSISTYSSDAGWQGMTNEWIDYAFVKRYMYNFSWLGRPIIQFPADMVAVQEMIWSAKPDLVIETGIAHGGSLILSASILAMLDLADAAESGELLDPRKPKRKVLGVDIDIRAHNRAALEKHPFSNRLHLIQGSSVAPETLEQVRAIARDYRKIMVFLDSNHTHDHVLAELEAYAPLTSIGSYCVVFDTIVEDLPDDRFPDRPWSIGNNPKTALRKYLETLKSEGRKGVDGGPLHLECDAELQDKLMLTASPEGYLKRS